MTPIKSNELRIGNLFQDKDGNILTCQGVCEGGKDEPTIVWYDVNNGLFLDIDECFVVVLNDEWLNKLGIDDDVFLQWSIQKHNPNGYLIYRGHGCMYVVVNYVHQLQNINHSLTGEELIK